MCAGIDVQQAMPLCEASAGARFAGGGAPVHRHAHKVSAEGFQRLEEMWEGLAGAGRIFDGDPRTPVTEEVEAAENPETHRHAMILVGVDGDGAVGRDAAERVSDHARFAQEAVYRFDEYKSRKPASGDLLLPPALSKHSADAMTATGNTPDYAEIPGNFGHLDGVVGIAAVAQQISAFLN